MAYSPGVGYVCKDIEKNPELIDTLTLRGRSVAVVTQGNMFADDPIEPGKMMPIVDWVIAQIKFYGEVDAFPFILRKEASLVSALEDLSNTYASILLLDDFKIEPNDLPKDSAVLYQSDVISQVGGNKTACEVTSRVIALALKEKKKGLLDSKFIAEGASFQPSIFKTDETYFVKMNTDKSTAEKAYQLHERFNGIFIFI